MPANQEPPTTMPSPQTPSPPPALPTSTSQSSPRPILRSEESPSSSASTVHDHNNDRASSLHKEPDWTPQVHTNKMHDDSDTLDSQSINFDLRQHPTHVSVAGLDAVDVALDEAMSCIEVPDSAYDRFTARRKTIIVALISFCSFLAPVSSTSVLAASPEVASEFNTTGTIINLSNAMYMLSMAICPVFWGPLNTVYGRRPILITCSSLFLASSVGTALAPDLGSFFFFRIATAFQGTAFVLVGSACIADIYRPAERGTALGWFLSGTLIGPAIGPFFGGIVVTYTSWRIIFWVQTGLAAIAMFGSMILVPETILHKKIDDLVGYSQVQKTRAVCTMLNPIRVIELYRYPNLVMAGLAAAAMIWNMYSLLTPIRYILNPRFNLESPMMSGLFYLAPGCGYLTGSFMGGRYADYTLRKWIEKRGGERVPEDRLRSAIPFMGIVIPICIMVYGWSVEKNIGGIPLAVITLYLQGVAQLFCFPAINTYCMDVNQARSAEVIGGNYLFRYIFAAGGSAIVLPAIDAMGLGWYTTISTAFLIISTGGLLACIKWGKGWRESIDNERRRKRLEARVESGKLECEKEKCEQ
ncbi:hypothetical protein BROUX41_000251 [Berkeleyomyces rouxiae]|uniref:uncharacterized protein n=1 Tax=Berkeleyomyces rouxiae TaxID=2035830 RepID=UPI003B7E3772